MGWLTLAEPWLLPLPMGLHVSVGNSSPAASKSLGQKSRDMQWDPRQHGRSRGHRASVVPAVLHASSDAPSTSLGLCWQPSTGSCLEQPGYTCLTAAPQAAGGHRLSPAAGMSLLWGQAELQFRAGLVWARGGRNRPGRAGRGCGHSYAKSIPLGAVSWFKRSLFSVQLQLPSSAGCSQSSAAPAEPSGSGDWLGQPHAAAPSRQPGGQTPRPQGSQQKASRASSTLRPQTSRAGTVTVAGICRTNPMLQPHRPLCWASPAFKSNIPSASSLTVRED